MNERQKVKYEMFQHVQTNLDDNSGVWNTVPIQATLKSSFDGIISKIGISLAEQASVVFGIGKDKEKLKRIIAEGAAVLADTMNAFANIVPNPVLANATDMSFSDINKSTNTGIVSIVEGIIALARTHKAALKDYGISEGMVRDLETSLDDFKAISTKPRAATVQRSLTVKDIDNLIGEGDDLLNNKLDKLFKKYKLTNTRFYEGYMQARIIVD